MVVAKIRRFVKNSNLSPNMIYRFSYIIKLFEAVSSGLPRKKLDNTIFISINNITAVIQTTG